MRFSPPFLKIGSKSISLPQLGLGTATLCIGGYLLLSLRWRMVHDLPLLHYLAYMMHEHGAIPYKDLFETAMPGTFLFHYLFTQVAGYGDLGYRIGDILGSILMMGLTFGILRPLGKHIAWGGALLWVGVYLNLGPAIGLQKDYVGLVALVGAGWVMMREWPQSVRTFLAGLCAGLAIWVKPTLGIGLIPLIGLLGGKDTHRPKQLVGLVAGVGVSSLGFIGWLVHLGAWATWGEIFLAYLPLHIQLGQFHQLSTGASWQATFYGMEGFFLAGGNVLYLIAPIVLLLQRKRLSVQARFILANMALFLFYPAFSGQFWAYHWVPFLYWATLGMSLLIPHIQIVNPRKWRSILSMLVLGLFVGWQSYRAIRLDPSAIQQRLETVDELAGWLGKHTQPKDHIQPLDWTQGALHAMLIARCPIATRYLYDYHFAHHLSLPIIQRLRTDFQQQMHDTPPDWIVEMKKRPRVSGPNTSQIYPWLSYWLASRYSCVRETQGYRIYQLKAD